LKTTKKRHTPLRYIRIIFDFTVMFGVVFMIAVFALTAGPDFMPETVESGGLVGRYGMRVVLTWLFMSGLVLTGTMFLISRFPKLQRFPVPITADNIELQYILLKMMLSSVQIVLTIYFVDVMINVYRFSIKLASPDFAQKTAIAGLACAAVLILYYIAAQKNK